MDVKIDFILGKLMQMSLTCTIRRDVLCLWLWQLDEEISQRKKCDVCGGWVGGPTVKF